MVQVDMSDVGKMCNPHFKVRDIHRLSETTAAHYIYSNAE